MPEELGGGGAEAWGAVRSQEGGGVVQGRGCQGRGWQGKGPGACPPYLLWSGGQRSLGERRPAAGLVPALQGFKGNEWHLQLRPEESWRPVPLAQEGCRKGEARDGQRSEGC